MTCQIPDAKRYRKEVPLLEDDELRRKLRKVLLTHPASRTELNTPKWKVYRSLVKREAHRRGLYL